MNPGLPWVIIFIRIKSYRKACPYYELVRRQELDKKQAAGILFQVRLIHSM